MGKPETTGEKRDTRFKPGQSGNPAGRPKGARHALGSDFIREMHEVFKTRGRAAIEELAEKKPEKFVGALVAMLPKELSLDEETTDALADVILQRRKKLTQ